jgi:cytochrome P450
MNGVEPWQLIEEVQQRGDIVWDESLNAWVITSFDEVRKMAQADGTDYTSPFVPDDTRKPYGLSTADYIWFMGHGSEHALMLIEGEEHHKQHRWWLNAFSPRVLSNWREEVIRPIAEHEIARIAPLGRAELWSDYSERVGSRVIAAVMGLPHEDEAWFRRLFEVSSIRFAFKEQLTNPNPDPAFVKQAMDATQEMYDMLEPIVLSRKAGDGDDFISMIWRDSPGLFGDDWERHAVSLAGVTFESAAQTTQYSTANGVYMLLKYPELADELREGGNKLLSAFVEESLRLYGPVLFRLRYATRDLEVGGVTIRKGDSVIGLTISAARDAAEHQNPGVPDLHRPNGRRHMSFWAGPKVCPGANLARVELQVAIDALMRGLPDVRFDPEAAPPNYDSLVFRKWAPLNAVWTPPSN